MVISQIKMPTFKKVGKSKYEWQFDTHRGFIQKMPNSSIWEVWQPSVQDRMLGKFRTLTTAKEHVYANRRGVLQAECDSATR